MSSMNTNTNTSSTDYNPSFSNPSSTNPSTTDYTSNIDSTTLATQPPPTHHLHQSSDVLPGVAPTGSRDAAGSDRPLDVRPTPQGGVAPGGNPDLPPGHASMADKLVGKTQKVAGKMTHNPELHEKGELREAGGKLAAQGRARAPHD